MSSPGVIPIADARRVGQKGKCPMIVIFAIEEDASRFTVTTWGKTKALCRLAASFGDQFTTAVLDGRVGPPEFEPTHLHDRAAVRHSEPTT